ncbi:hypothetical protein [Nocardioides conyzicola]|uniref:ATP-binding protein n=1 Tax=Nocardioides conyzicola TaxID=1651781 RepID=A0ABP8XTS8_9ACTN
MITQAVGEQWHDGRVVEEGPGIRATLLHADFEELLDGGGTGHALPFDALADLATSRGRVLLQAPAGSGKTSLLLALVKAENDAWQGHYLDLGRLDAGEREWFRTADTAEEWLWSRLSKNRTRPAFVCVDSLDEIPIEQGQNVLDAIDSLTSSRPDWSVIVADRPGRRRIRPTRWALVTLPALEVSEVEKATGVRDAPHWLQLPYFVNRWRYGGGTNPAQVIAVSAQSAMTPDEMDRVGLGALRTWQLSDNSDWIRKGLSPDLIDRMMKSGLMSTTQEGQPFLHVLVHGYFAARAVSTDRELWTKPTFEALTFKGATFDALGMLLTMIQDEDVDRLVRQVDDWNFYAAAFLLAEDHDSGERTSEWLSSALLLLLGVRRLSPVPSTRLQVEDSLRLHAGPLAAEVLQAGNEADLVGLARQCAINNVWWDRWLSIYERMGDDVVDYELDALSDQDSVLAWTAANVLLRQSLDDAARRRIADLMDRGADAASRWRAVHVLGGGADVATASMLLERFHKDQSIWVQTGALRSLILVASRLPESTERTEIFAELADKSRELLANPKFLREVERSTQVSPVPDDWPVAVGVLIEELWAHSATIEEQDRWRRLSAGLRTRWSGLSHLGTL